MAERDADPVQADFVAGLAGDKRAYERALSSIADRVRHRVRTRIWAGVDDSEIEDVVQTVLVAIHEKRATFETGLPLMAWVSGITKYKTLQHLRSDRKRRAVISEKDWDLVSDTVGETKQSDPMSRHDIEMLLETLSQEHRDAVTLTKLEGLSTRDAAERSGVSLSAMKVRVHRAMEKLKAQVKDK